MLALACGGAQQTSGSQAQAPTTSSADTANTAPPTASPASSASADHEAKLKRLAQEQAEMFQLFQLLAGQVESLQTEVDELRAAQDTLKNQPPPRPSRPTRPRPQPDSIYSIPIADNPSVGSKRPLVTIVKAFEFA